MGQNYKAKLSIIAFMVGVWLVSKLSPPSYRKLLPILVTLLAVVTAVLKFGLLGFFIESHVREQASANGRSSWRELLSIVGKTLLLFILPTLLLSILIVIILAKR